MFAMMMCFSAKAQEAVTESQKAINVGVMLPLHNVDGDGRRMVEYYRGILMAVEKMKQDGMNVNVHAWNVAKDDNIGNTLKTIGAAECNVIFGPLYTTQVKELGDFCKAYNIEMVIPFSINGDEVDKNPNIYQVYQTPEEFNEATVQHLSSKFKDHHIVLIDCNDSTSNKGTFTSLLRQTMEKQGQEIRITNLNSSDEDFTRAFTLAQPNLVILNTGRSPELTKVMSRMDAIVDANPSIKISLFGYKEWLIYIKYNKEKYAKYDTYVPSNFFYNDQSSATKLFEYSYKENFKEDMQFALPHFALTGYDHAMYFVAKRNAWLQTPLKFKQTPGGGYRNKTFMFVHFRPDGGIEALNY